MKITNYNDEKRKWLINELEDKNFEDDIDDTYYEKGDIGVSVSFINITDYGYNESKMKNIYHIIKSKNNKGKYYMGLIFITSYLCSISYDMKYYDRFKKCKNIDDIINLVNIKDIEKMCNKLSIYNSLNEATRMKIYEDSLRYKDYIYKIFPYIINDYLAYLDGNYLKGIIESYKLYYHKYKDEECAIVYCIDEYTDKLIYASIHDFENYEKEFLKLLSTYCKYNKILLKKGKKIDPCAKYIIDLKNNNISNIIINSINNEFLISKMIDTYIASYNYNKSVDKKKIKNIIVKKGKKSFGGETNGKLCK